MLIDPFRRGPPEFFITAGVGDTIIGFNSGSFGSVTGDLNIQLPNAGQSLTLVRFYVVGTVAVQLQVKIQGASSLPSAHIFESVQFTDKNGVPRELFFDDAATLDAGSNTRTWAWNGQAQYLANGADYDLLFTEPL